MLPFILMKTIALVYATTITPLLRSLQETRKKKYHKSKLFKAYPSLYIFFFTLYIFLYTIYILLLLLLFFLTYNQLILLLLN
ncbi:hypothetical protein BDF21DRAFT_405865, partial [Thamnidium elegans]